MWVLEAWVFCEMVGFQRLDEATIASTPTHKGVIVQIGDGSGYPRRSIPSFAPLNFGADGVPAIAIEKMVQNPKHLLFMDLHLYGSDHCKMWVFEAWVLCEMVGFTWLDEASITSTPTLKGVIVQIKDGSGYPRRSIAAFAPMNFGGDGVPAIAAMAGTPVAPFTKKKMIECPEHLQFVNLHLYGPDLLAPKCWS